MSIPGRLSLNWVEVEGDLARLDGEARPIEVAGVPPDLVKLVQRHEPMPLGDVLHESYLPNLLTWAYLRFGRAHGVFGEDQGRLRVEPRHRLELLAPRLDRRPIDAFFDHLRARVRPEYYQCPRSTLDDDLARSIGRAGDLWRGMRALSIGDGDGVALWLRDVGVEDVGVIDIDPHIADYYQSHGVRAFVADSRFCRDFVFGAFDLVRSYQIEGAQDDCLRRMAYANLKAYGVYYTYFVGNENERHALFEFLLDLERRFVVTSVWQHHGSYVIRAVKVPEIEAFYRTRRVVRRSRFDDLIEPAAPGTPRAGL
jgi:SAM-dependent methyltransferase